MEWYYVVVWTVLYFTMGFGVLKRCEDLTTADCRFLMMIAWPVVLFIVAVCDVD
jgi:hypothetical protein